MGRNLAFIFVVFFIILALGCAPKSSFNQQTPSIAIQDKTLSEGSRTIALADYSPPNLLVNAKNIQLNEKIVKRTSNISFADPIVSANYSFTNTIKIADNNLTFDISLTQSPIELGGDIVGFPVVFDFVISNNTNDPIRIKWDEVSYIDQSGFSHRVIRNDTRLLEKDRPTGDIVVPPKAKIEEMIYPSDLIFYSSGEYGGWKSTPLIENIKQNEKVSVFIPVSIRDEVINYTLTFEAKK